MPGLPPSLLRRLIAILYDSLLLCGILLLASLPLPLIPQTIYEMWWMRLLVQLYLLAGCLMFFGWFWVHGGQTLGMRAWRIQVVQVDGSKLSWGVATTRFLAAIVSWLVLGLGFLWVLFDNDKMAWHDRLSRTRLIVTPKKSKKSGTTTVPSL